MNREEAKLILSSYRPGDQDRKDPFFAEALALVEQDSELKKWFEAQRLFDGAMAAQVHGIPVPATLKQSILDTTAGWWWRIEFSWRPAAVCAACVALLTTGVFIWQSNQPIYFRDACAELTGRSWELSHHVQFESKDLWKVRKWLAAHDASSNFSIPVALTNATVRGCSIVDWHGQKVPVLCLREESRHMHLIVADLKDVAGGPGENRPELDDYGRIRMASWKHKEKTYVLTGFNSGTFVRKFRQGGQWNLSS